MAASLTRCAYASSPAARTAAEPPSTVRWHAARNLPRLVVASRAPLCSSASACRTAAARSAPSANAKYFTPVCMPWSPTLPRIHAPHAFMWSLSASGSITSASSAFGKGRSSMHVSVPLMVDRCSRSPTPHMPRVSACRLVLVVELW